MSNVMIFPVGGTGGGPSTPSPVAATFVVSPTPGVGDYTTIQAALNALPAEGGYLLVREGTYPTTTNTLPVGKPVVIRGCGDATILSLGALGTFAFTVPDGYTQNTRLVFENFIVTGTEVAGQAVCAYADSKGLAEIFFQDVNTTGTEQFVQVQDGSFDGTTPGQDDVKIHLFRCRIRPCTTNASIMIKVTSLSFINTRTWMKEVQLEGDNIFAVNPPRTDPLWGNITDDNYFGDLYLDTCEFSLGGDAFQMDVGVIQAVNCWFTNNDSTTPVVSGFTEGSVTGNGGTTFTGCTLRAISFTHFDNATYVGCTLDAWHCVAFTQTTFQGCYYTNTYGSPYPFNAGDDPYVIENFSTGTSITSGFWANADAWPTGIVNGIQASVIEIFAETTIIGNDFSDVDPPAVIGIIEVFNAHCVFAGNRFPFAPTSGPPMKDWNGSNYYYGNSELFWEASGPILPPAGDGLTPGKGLSNTVEGIRSWNGNGSVGGVATNNIVVNYRNPMGLVQTKGYIKNSGANNITVREQYITFDEGTFTRSTVVTPGNIQNLDPFDFTGLGAGIDFQVVKYTVDVSGTTISWQTHFAAPGGVDHN
jgi:hypothetical protein